MLPQMTGRQRYRANALIKKLCANYDDGNCLLLDEGEGCVCVQSISYSLLCRYFRNAVLPADPALEAEILECTLTGAFSAALPLSSVATGKSIVRNAPVSNTKGSRQSTQEKGAQNRKIEGKKSLI